VLTIEDETKHADHFWVRDAASGGERPVNKYLDRLDDIRRLQDYVAERARDYGVPVFENSNKGETVGAVIQLVLASEAELETV
jgi:2-phosphoglycerate kinase